MTVREALAAIGRAPGEIGGASRRGERLLGYCELHIEQGPVLEGRDAPVGVVTAIAGATRAEVRFNGRAGHAGTVPMELRHDAACALAEFVLAVEAAGRAEPGLVATVGRLAALPGAPNVIPGSALASLDVRHADDAVRAAAVDALRDRASRDRRGTRGRGRLGAADGGGVRGDGPGLDRRSWPRRSRPPACRSCAWPAAPATMPSRCPS